MDSSAEDILRRIKLLILQKTLQMVSIQEAELDEDPILASFMAGFGGALSLVLYTIDPEKWEAGMKKDEQEFFDAEFQKIVSKLDN